MGPKGKAIAAGDCWVLPRPQCPQMLPGLWLLKGLAKISCSLCPGERSPEERPPTCLCGFPQKSTSWQDATCELGEPGGPGGEVLSTGKEECPAALLSSPPTKCKSELHPLSVPMNALRYRVPINPRRQRLDSQRHQQASGESRNSSVNHMSKTQLQQRPEDARLTLRDRRVQGSSTSQWICNLTTPENAEGLPWGELVSNLSGWSSEPSG